VLGSAGIAVPVFTTVVWVGVITVAAKILAFNHMTAIRCGGSGCVGSRGRRAMTGVLTRAWRAADIARIIAVAANIVEQKVSLAHLMHSTTSHTLVVAYAVIRIGKHLTLLTLARVSIGQYVALGGY